MGNIARYLEYIIILIYLIHEPDLKSIFLILRLYLIFNLMFVILQINGLIESSHLLVMKIQKIYLMIGPQV